MSVSSRIFSGKRSSLTSPSGRASNASFVGAALRWWCEKAVHRELLEIEKKYGMYGSSDTQNINIHSIRTKKIW